SSKIRPHTARFDQFRCCRTPRLDHQKPDRLLGIPRGRRYAFPMPMQMTPLAVSAYTATSALGRGLASHVDALVRGRSGLRPNDISSAPLACWIGRVDGVETVSLPAGMDDW